MPRHRLIFIRFADLPLFWRIDLEVFARSAHRDPNCDGRATASSEDWSPAESALNNAIAAVKACKRGNSIQARQLLERAFLRLLLPWSGLTARDAILQLVGYARAAEPTLIPFADDVERLAL
jgi:hypothetical protein